jgi:hypothetical protein
MTRIEYIGGKRCELINPTPETGQAVFEAGRAYEVTAAEAAMLTSESPTLFRKLEAGEEPAAQAETDYVSARRARMSESWVGLGARTSDDDGEDDDGDETDGDS